MYIYIYMFFGFGGLSKGRGPEWKIEINAMFPSEPQ